jgi:hypothetical protein
VAAAVGVTATTVANIRQRYVKRGLEGASYDRPRRRCPRKLDEKGEATLIALAQSRPPEGRRTWTVRLLAGRLVEMGVVDSISPTTVWGVLKNGLRTHVVRKWCIPKVDEELVCRMEEVLDLYAEPENPQEPVVCVDERPYQLIADAVPPLLACPEVPRREDYTYQRRGVCHLWVILCSRQC